jgi:hypothetical protein
MDAAGLIVLLAELDADSAVASDAARKASQRISEDALGHLEACAYELARLYNVLEKIFERICEQFENHFERRGDYHERLIQRLSLDLEGIRPAFIPKGRVQAIRELKGFRHVTRHAYDIVLRKDRLAELVQIAETVSAELPGWSHDFVAAVRAQQGWN